jgi:tRNA threonylcarbamoyladenosine biosynthesis protein TsaE
LYYIKYGWQGGKTMYKIITGDEGETMLLGEKLGLAVTFPCVIVLTGDLGAGKTTFMRGLGRGMEVVEDISSPSFTILSVHQGRMEVYHFDFYRLTGLEELWDLDLDEYFYGEGVSVVEWGDKFPSLLPPAYLEVNLAPVPGRYNARVLTFIPRGNYAETLIREMRNHAGSGD